ncbi:hypothetical protein [Halomonas sp. PR-M31]|uniref:hypothetical protein n=1 Tax=Halomonas sp. PR-M31 TaxID=1471202 RepID=UPI0006514AC0|nr:hypothetical protein [Halomonas sp. PR-M31]
MKPTATSLRYYEREIFKENRFLGLPHGVAAVGPTILIVLTCLRLSLDHTDLLMWVLPIITYLIAYSILVSHLPRREELKALAIQTLYDDMGRKVRQLELCFDESEWREEDVEKEDERSEFSMPASFLPVDRELA